MNGRLSTLVAGGLLAFGLLALLGIVVLAALGTPVPSVLENLAAGALGAFSALLARVGGETQPVQVVNRANEPVPVEPADAGRTLLGTLGVVLIVLAVGLALLTLVGAIAVSYVTALIVGLIGLTLTLVDGNT